MRKSEICMWATGTDAEKFLWTFAGNERAHYEWRSPKSYVVKEEGITLADVERHLRGDEPGLLCVPILDDGTTILACIDADRHQPKDKPIDCAAVAKRITELGLPLIITKSKSE